MNNKPATWDFLLKSAPKGSVLMGGAVRDYIVVTEAKDYDIFYHYTPGAPLIPGWLFHEPNHEDIAHQAEYDIGGVDGQPSPIAAVWNYDVMLPNTKIIKVQLIGVQYPDPTQHFQNFDHTLTLGLYSEHGMYVDKRLLNSLETKTVTCTNKSKVIKSLKRAHSVIQRIWPVGYLDWKYLGFIEAPAPEIPY